MCWCWMRPHRRLNLQHSWQQHRRCVPSLELVRRAALPTMLCRCCYVFGCLRVWWRCPEELCVYAYMCVYAPTPQVQSLVMVGDPQQLPPTVRCQEAERLGLGLSLFERVQAMGLKPLLLDTQYRMHPKLAEFPSAKFYKGLLASWPKPLDRPLPPGLPWPNPQVS